eukprot:s5487_g3.t1
MHVAEPIAADMIVSGQVRMNIWELGCDCLPAGDLRREASTDCVSGVSFCSGAYSQGPLFGLRRNTLLLPWVTLLINKYIKSRTHETYTSFVLQRKTTMCVHRDINNDPGSVNVILPCSTFRGGGLWLESPGGDCPSMDGSLQGRRHNLTMPGIAFNPHQWHETCPWEGHHITIAVYTVKAVRTLAPADVDTLRRLQFALPS